MNIAIMREVSSNIIDCEITNITRIPIDPNVAKEQHSHYADTLRNLGYKIHMIEADNDLPDSVFVEDTAVVLDELAIITRPGTASRRAETDAVVKALTVYKDLEYINSTGTLDGGDVLRVGKTLFVGKSCRSSAVGISLLREIVEPYGYEVISVSVEGCLHLKSAVTQVAEKRLLINPSWVNPEHFGDIEYLTVDTAEPYGANALFLENAVIYPIAFPRTREMLINEGLNVISIDMSELAKAEGGVTCCSLILDF